MLSEQVLKMRLGNRTREWIQKAEQVTKLKLGNQTRKWTLTLAVHFDGSQNCCGHNLPAQVRQIFYGQLICMIDVIMPRSHTINLNKVCCYLLVVLQPCSTHGKDATREVTTCSESTIPVVVDLHTVECVVGRVKRGDEWGIIDHSREFSRTVFVDPEVEVE
jgi:hypothetical protein